jgi:hypothetical protein
MLHLDFIYVRVRDSLTEVPIELFRVERSQKLSARSDEVGHTLRQWLAGSGSAEMAAVSKDPFGDDDISILPLKLGLSCSTASRATRWTGRFHESAGQEGCPEFSEDNLRFIADRWPDSGRSRRVPCPILCAQPGARSDRS